MGGDGDDGEGGMGGTGGGGGGGGMAGVKGKGPCGVPATPGPTVFPTMFDELAGPLGTNVAQMESLTKEKTIKTSKLAKKTAESKFKYQGNMKLKTQASVEMMKERSVKGCLGNETSERIAKENEAKPKEKERKSKEWEGSAKKLQKGERSQKGTNLKEKEWKEEANKKLMVTQEKQAKEPLMKRAALMAKIERLNKERMDKHSKELENKEM